MLLVSVAIGSWGEAAQSPPEAGQSSPEVAQSSLEEAGSPPKEAQSSPAPPQSINEILETLDPELADVSAQIDAQEFKPAIIILEQRIRSIETTTHRYDESLVVPLT
ncbi:MAG: hypothetical protein O7F71_04790, partial [Gammaproteobacteria bacterium]|nr:hypothetical protein [Gammaproteobacteria bacterium]